LTELKTEIEGFKAELKAKEDKLKTKVVSQTQELNELKTEIEGLKAELKQSYIHNDKLLDEFQSQQRKHENTVQRLTQQLENETLKLQSFEKENVFIENEKEREAKELTAKLEDTEARLISVHQNLHKTKDEKQAMQEEHENELQFLAQELKEQKEDSNTKVAAYQAENQLLKEQQEETKTKMQATLEQLAELVEEKELLLQSQEKYVQQIKELEKKPKKAPVTSKHKILQAGSIKLENARLHEEITTLTAELKKKDQILQSKNRESENQNVVEKVKPVVKGTRSLRAKKGKENAVETA